MKIKKVNQSIGYVGSIIDNLESASNQDALSANQGKILNEQINALLPSSFIVNINDEYVYTEDLQIRGYQIGKLTIIVIGSIAFKQIMPNYTQFLTNLPAPVEYAMCTLYGQNGAEGKTIRCGVFANEGKGAAQTHWSNDALVGDSANNQYTGIFIYLAV